VPQARKMDRISYDEMLELASLGAGVMHSRAIEFGKKYNVPIHVRSSLTDAPGTMIVAETPDMEDIVVRGATLKKDLARVLITGVPDKPGVAAHVFARIARHNIAVDDIIQNVDHGKNTANIGFTTTSADAREAQTVCEELGRELKFSGVQLDQNVAKVSIVGVGMKTHTGVAARMFSALAEARINIQNISTSEIVISCIVGRDDGERALQAIHKAFDLDKA